ncbi:putative MFS family arabinose efflux permease [Nocardioides albertanoniae]|uniref:Putative MFS family arabinose efflux permease n=1 Tax=Nocardioides albertanoniae TaxID=1175486 RepID=A0A543A317_9ACTN|nr:MFS transporter [Nocardioides albertanoniae]TQL66977.1 putative MFS family arabinose efflux permease [Nocardioides albertanoniae]
MDSSQTSRATLPVLLLAQFVTPLSIAGTAIALPLISQDLGTNETGLQWAVNGFNVTFALFALVWGAVSDRIGYRAAFRAGSVLVVAGGALSAAAPSLLILDVARLVAGVGAASILTGSTALISHLFEGSRRTRAFAVFGTVNGLGLALGPSMSGGVIGLVGWRGVFAVQAAFVLIALLGSVAIPAIRTAAAEPGGKAPILDVGLLANREFLATCLVPVAGSVGFVTLLTYLPSALSGVRGMDASTSGALMLVMTLPVLVAPMLVSRAVTTTEWVTIGRVIYASLAFLAVGAAGMMLLSIDGPIAALVVPMLLIGAGFGLPIGLVDGHALSVVPAQRAGTAAGLLNFGRIGSEALFVAVYALAISTLIGRDLPGDAGARTAAGQPGHPEVYLDAFHVVALGLAGLVVLITVAVIALRAAARRVERSRADLSAHPTHATAMEEV